MVSSDINVEDNTHPNYCRPNLHAPRELLEKVAAKLKIPMSLQGEFCSDLSHFREISVSPIEDRPDWIMAMPPAERYQRLKPLGIWCHDCGLPSGPYILELAIRECEGCGSYYVPKFEDYPIRYFLCKKCDVPSTKPKKRRIVTAVTINVSHPSS